MWCKNCNIETEQEKCPLCGSTTEEDTPIEVFWCNSCKVPVLQKVSQADKGICPKCKNKIKHMASDLRPVFPEERLLLEILLGSKPHEYINKSVWVANSRYYIDGKAKLLPSSIFMKSNVSDIVEQLNNSTFPHDFEWKNIAQP